LIELVRIIEPGSLKIAEGELNSLGESDVRLRMEAVGICGSDVALMNGTHPYAHYPVTPGHELAGRILETAQQNRIEVGQLVAVRPTLSCDTCNACLDGRTNNCTEVQVLGVHLDGGMAAEMIVPFDLIYPCPEPMTADHAAIVEPTAVAVHACRRAGLGRGMSLTVIGSGVIGMLAIQIARAWGCAPIFAVDRVPERLGIAKSLGADEVLNNQESDVAATGRELCPDGFDVVLDMVGSNRTLVDAIALARRGGSIVPVALPHGSVDFDFEPLYRKELSIIGSRLYNGDFEQAIELIASGAVDTDAIITHHYSLQDAFTAFTMLMEQPEEAIKVVVTP
jgi:2-desacetyl-2-hydroxyethyl bacteriochlorophyllide A dehydrogenase